MRTKVMLGKIIKAIMIVLLLFVIVGMGMLSACKKSDEIIYKTFLDLVSEITGEKIDSINDVPYYFNIGSDDSYCEIDTNPLDIDDFSSDIALLYIKKMNEALGLPEYLYKDMLNTSYFQGKQEEVFDRIKVKYYYHPDQGLDVIYYRI